MRKLGLIPLSLALGGLFACDRSSPPEQASTIAQSPDQAVAEAPSTPEPYDRLDQLQLGMEQAYFDELFEALELQRPPERPPLPPGFFEQFERGLPLQENWMNCTRYLTNNAAAGFCEDEPPASWRPFIFNEQRYFLVPLGPAA